MEIISEFISFMIQIFLWYIFWTIVFRVASLWLKRNAPNDDERREMVERVAKMIHEIKPEQHGDIIYWFDAETDQFLGQGRNEEEIKQHLLERFKGHVFVVDNRALAGPNLEEMSLEKLKLSADIRTIQ